MIENNEEIQLREPDLDDKTNNLILLANSELELERIQKRFILTNDTLARLNPSDKYLNNYFSNKRIQLKIDMNNEIDFIKELKDKLDKIEKDLENISTT